ncbi:MAG: aldose 1-epimerase [Bryobacteraceae bacterium]
MTSSMRAFKRAKLYLALICPVVALGAPRYTAERMNEAGVEIIRLADSSRSEQVSVLPSYGNRAYEFKVHGNNLLYNPFPDAAALNQDRTRGLNGIPFLAPWANRIGGGGFWANGKHYLFNDGFDNLRISPDKVAMHGLMISSRYWEVEEVAADDQSAHVTSHLVFWKYPELMVNWPFAHEYRMTYRLHEGVLEVRTEVTNKSSEPMPITLGFHPYFNLPQIPRSEASIRIPARKHVETDAKLLATGELTPNQLPQEISLRDHTFDDGFTDLIRDENGHAVFSFEAGAKKIQVIYGPRYQVGLVYAPPRRDFVCFEPMTAITNALNLAHDGKYAELKSVEPGQTWRESFWIRYEGF